MPPSCGSATSSRTWAWPPRSRSPRALAKQAETRQRLGQILVDDGIVTELDLARALGAKFGVTYIDLTEVTAGRRRLGLHRRAAGAPLRRRPRPLPGRRHPARRHGRPPEPRGPAGPRDHHRLQHPPGHRQRRGHLRRHRQDLPRARRDRRGQPRRRASSRSSTASPPTSARPATRRPSSSSSTPSSRSPWTTAPATSTSSRRPRSCSIRFRIDGVLHEIMSVPRRMQPAVISRLKIMAELDIAERRVPQDGRIGLVVGGKPIDMRVATPAHGVRREGRHAPPGQVQRAARTGGPGLLGEGPQAVPQVVPQALRRHPRHRPHRLGQVHHAVRGAQHPQLLGEERHHRGGPGGVPPDRHQPGAGEHAGPA